MRPSSISEILLGLGAAVFALALILVFAFVPDPFFQRRVYATSFDNVEGLAANMPVFYAGARIGDVRSIRLRPDSSGFSARLALERGWRPTPCSFVQVISANPLTAPRIEIASPREACTAALVSAHCTPVPGEAEGRTPLLTGCRRRSDLFETAQAALNDVASIANTARVMVAKFTAQRPGDSGGGVDVNAVMAKSMATLDSVQALTRRLDDTMTPGRGDVALTLANVRRVSGKAAELDVAKLNTTLESTRATVADLQKLVHDNQEAVTSLIGNGRTLGDSSTVLLETLSTSLAATSASLQRTTGNLDTLSERLSADPTFALRGQRFVDPPTPGAKR